MCLCLLLIATCFSGRQNINMGAIRAGGATQPLSMIVPRSKWVVPPKKEGFFGAGPSLPATHTTFSPPPHVHVQLVCVHRPPLSKSPAMQSFTRDSADILLLVITRLSLLPAIALVAVAKGKPPEAAPPSANASGENGAPARDRSLWRRICCCFGGG